MKALVLDFGGPVLVTPFERLRVAEAAGSLPAGSCDWSGPFDPAADPLWQQMQAGEITEPAYWERRGEQYDAATGSSGGLRNLMQVMYDGADAGEAALVRPAALAAIERARAAGMPVGVLTNDLTAFHSDEWVSRLTVLAGMDAVVDARRDGVRKPDPAAYELVCARLGVGVGDAVFVDDQPANIEGAARAGLVPVLFDVAEPERGFAAALAALGIATGTG